MTSSSVLVLVLVLEHGVGEPAVLGEVLCVPLQVAEVVIQGHLVRPVAVREPRRPPDVVNAGCPGGVIGLVVLRPERGQPEFPGYEPLGYREVFRDEQLVVHPAILTRLAGRRSGAQAAAPGRRAGCQPSDPHAQNRTSWLGADAGPAAGTHATRAAKAPRRACPDRPQQAERARYGSDS